MRPLPVPWARKGALGALGGFGVAGGIVAVPGWTDPPACPGLCAAHRVCGRGEFGCPSACTAAMCWLVGVLSSDFGILARLLLVSRAYGVLIIFTQVLTAAK
jgi:hypothetical protein